MAWNGYRSDDNSEYQPGLLDEAEWPVPTSARVPVAAMIVAMSGAWAVSLVHGGMTSWGVSASALSHGRYETIALHMFAHGGLWHILMNMAALWEIGPRILARLGAAPASWMRLFAVFILSGFAGMALHLAVHPFGDIPMLGASGAIYGLLGLLLRLPPEGSQLESIRSPKMKRAVIALIKENLWLVLFLTLPALLIGRGGGVAWEAHLGGFLFGALVGPMFLPVTRGAERADLGPPGTAMSGYP